MTGVHFPSFSCPDSWQLHSLPTARELHSLTAWPIYLGGLTSQSPSSLGYSTLRNSTSCEPQKHGFSLLQVTGKWASCPTPSPSHRGPSCSISAFPKYRYPCGWCHDQDHTEQNSAPEVCRRWPWPKPSNWVKWNKRPKRMPVLK